MRIFDLHYKNQRQTPKAHIDKQTDGQMDRQVGRHKLAN